MHNLQNIIVWKKGLALVKPLYGLTKAFPKDEKFGLISQLNRAAISVSCNIAEGCGRNNKKELRHFLGISLGSAYEIHTLLLLAKDLGYVDEQNVSDINKELIEIEKMLQKWIKNLNSSN